MRTSNILFSVVHLFVVLFIIAAGIFFIMLPSLSSFRVNLASLLTEGSAFFVKLGIAFLSFGFLLLTGFYFLNRKKYLKLKMGCGKTLIDEAIIKDYLKNYWQEVFPGQEVQSDIILHFPQKLEIIAQLPKIKEEEKDTLLARVQNELGVILARKLGYEKEFFLTIND
ncbi:MAG: hypothetical protein S4CHLAM37_09580 [Chlamydiia bacterium]|nr:hypothetical protein [Chlamydiia bacterium]